MTALLAITLLSLLVAGGSLLDNRFWRRQSAEYRKLAKDSIDGSREAIAQWVAANNRAAECLEMAKDAERRARRRSRRQPETPAPLPENADA